MNTTEDVYRFVQRLKAESERQGEVSLASRLDDALNLGSSGLEILGAIERLLGPDGDVEARQIVSFVDRAFGR